MITFKDVTKKIMSIVDDKTLTKEEIERKIELIINDYAGINFVKGALHEHKILKESNRLK